MKRAKYPASGSCLAVRHRATGSVGVRHGG